MFNEDIVICSGLVFLAVFGSVVKWLNVRKQIPSTFGELTVEATTAIFIGLLCCGAYSWLRLPKGLAFIVAGLGGHYGTKTIEWFSKYVVRYFKLDDAAKSGTVKPEKKE